MSNEYAIFAAPQLPATVRDALVETAVQLGGRGYTLRLSGDGHLETALAKELSARRIPYQQYLSFKPKHRELNVNEHVVNTKSSRLVIGRYIKRFRYLKWPQQLALCSMVATIIGADTRSAAEFVLCWTPDGTTQNNSQGRAGLGLRLAGHYAIKTYNLGDARHFELTANWLRDMSQSRVARLSK